MPKGKTVNVAQEPYDSIDDLLDPVEQELADEQPEHARARLRLDDGDLFAQALFEIETHWQPTGRLTWKRPTGRYAGISHRQLFDDLWLYAFPVIKSFIRRQRMGEVARRYHAPVPVSIRPEDMVVLAHSAPERDALALDVIAAAVVDFEHNALIRRHWSPAGGAALRTWFIGTCGLKFGRAYQKWSKDRADRLTATAARHGIDLDTIGPAIADQLADPASLAIQRADLTAVIDTAQPMTKQILAMIAAGMTHTQIGDELQLSPGAVTARLHRFRQRVRKYADRADERALLRPLLLAAPGWAGRR